MQAWTGSTSIRDNVAMARGHASDELLPVAPRLTARLQLAPKANRTVVTHTRIESMGPWRPAETMHVALSATLAPSEQSNHASAAIELRQPFRKALIFFCRHSTAKGIRRVSEPRFARHDSKSSLLKEKRVIKCFGCYSAQVVVTRERHQCFAKYLPQLIEGVPPFMVFTALFLRRTKEATQLTCVFEGHARRHRKSSQDCVLAGLHNQMIDQQLYG